MERLPDIIKFQYCFEIFNGKQSINGNKYTGLQAEDGLFEFNVSHVRKMFWIQRNTSKRKIVGGDMLQKHVQERFDAGL